MKKLLLKLFYFFIFCQICVGKKIICDKPANVELNENEIIFFETPNFPISINETTKNECNMHTTGNLDIEGGKLIFVITIGHITNAQITDGEKILTLNDTKSDLIYFYTNNKFINFKFTSKDFKLWEGFRGFVAHENAKAESDCPLANKKIHHFTNESDILYLRSSYFDFETDWPTKKKECAWRFDAPEGYGFKIDILDISGKVLVISNRTRNFIDRRLPYTYVSNNITIAYTTSFINRIIQNDYFSARISIFLPKESEKTESCIYQDYGSNISIWETQLQGYTNNRNCQKVILLRLNHQLYANVTIFEMEKNVDFLRYYLDEELLYPLEIVSPVVHTITSKKEARNITFEFLSDQSVINKGFHIEFKSVECKCNDPEWIIPCENEQNFSIMKNDDFLYCADLDCNFKLTINQSCENQSAEMQIKFESANSDFDSFQLISNNKTILNIINSEKEMFSPIMETALMLPNQLINLKFHSSSNISLHKTGSQTRPFVEPQSIGKFCFLAKSIPVPFNNPKVIIDDKKLVHIIKIDEIPSNSIQTMELSEDLKNNNESLELIYGTHDFEHLIQCITFYDNEDMMSIRTLRVLNTSLIFGSSLTIYKHINCCNEKAELIIKAKTKYSYKCLFHNNIINVANIMKRNHVLSMISTKNNSCEVTLVDNIGQFAIKELWTNSNEANVKVYNSENKSTVLFEFNSYTSSQWTSIPLNAMSYSIIIPPNKHILIEFYFPFHSIEFTKPSLSHYDTPFYSTPNIKPIFHNTTYEISQNLFATFTLTDIHISPKGFLKLHCCNGKVIELSDSHRIASNLSGTVIVFYFEFESGYMGAAMDIQIKAINPNVTNFPLSTNFPQVGWDGIENNTIEDFKCLFENGYTFFIGRIYRSLGFPDLYGIQNIKNARAAGFKFVDGYIFPCVGAGCPLPKDQLKAAIDRVKIEGAQIDMFWLSVIQLEWSTNVKYNQKIVLEFLKYSEIMGIKLGIFTTRDNWDILVSNDWHAAADKPLWYGNEGKNIYEKFVPFGGWKYPAVHQFKAQLPTPCGLNINYKIPYILNLH